MAVRYFRWRVPARVWLALIAVGVGAVVPCVASAGVLPDGRGYELVSPPDKNGGAVLQWSLRTHASADGNALAFASLVGFADAMGTGVTVDYLAQRRPEVGGWVTHALTPPVAAGSINTRGAGGDTAFLAFSPDLGGGILSSVSPVTSDDSVRDVGNLYSRSDLASAGHGSYQLLSGCPACDASNPPTPLPPVSGLASIMQDYLPRLAGASPDMQHAAFESLYGLTSDAPAQTAFCGDANPPFPPSPPAPSFCATRLYESDGGQVSLAGRVPVAPATECDDVNGPACVPADMSVAGLGAHLLDYTPHVVSDGSDGHSRVMFTQPTAADGTTYSQLDPIGQFVLGLVDATGNLFMRVDHARTVQINVSERTDCADHNPCTGAPERDTFAPARYLDATPDGRHVFFMTGQALTDDATPGQPEIYRYDVDASPHHLTLVGGPGVTDFLGASDDGHYAYMAFDSEMMMWHDGTVRDLGRMPIEGRLLDVVDASWTQFDRESRVTPDGRHFLLVSDRSPFPGGYDHGICRSGFGCHELYVYSADSNTWQCASCNPTGATATVPATAIGTGALGGALGEPYLNHPLSDDGRFVFFNSQEALVPEAVNGRMNAYEYNTVTGRVALLSTGTSAADSFFLDASPSGHDVFIATRDQLVGWDRDDAYDIYDVRIGGGFPEPPPVPVACSGGTCQGALSVPPAAGAPVSSVFTGAGNLPGTLRARARRLVCRHGFVKRRVHGRVRCVKVRRARARKARRASHAGQSARQTRSSRSG